MELFGSTGELPPPQTRQDNRFGLSGISAHISTRREKPQKKAKELGVEFLRFQFRDLRAKAASDMESMANARKLPGHTTEAMTRDHVRARIGEKVSPIQRKK